jgi:hypothetical protein
VALEVLVEVPRQETRVAPEPVDEPQIVKVRLEVLRGKVRVVEEFLRRAARWNEQRHEEVNRQFANRRSSITPELWTIDDPL